MRGENVGEEKSKEWIITQLIIIKNVGEGAFIH